MLDAVFLVGVEVAFGFNDFFQGLDLDPEVVHLLKDLAKLLGCVHRNDPFAIFVTFGNHLDT